MWGVLIIKKLSSYLLAIILILALITGCSAPINDATQTKVEKSKENSSAEKIAESSTPLSSETPSQTESKAPDTTAGNLLTVSYIDVGQGNSILIQSPNGKNMLIDAGESSSQTTVSNYLKDKGIKKIDVLVATHPHADHIGGMAYIIDNFDIGSIYMPKATTATKTYETLLTTIKSKGLSIKTAKSGVVIDLDSALTVNMVAPIGSSYDDLNAYSAVISKHK